MAEDEYYDADVGIGLAEEVGKRASDEIAGEIEIGDDRGAQSYWLGDAALLVTTSAHGVGLCMRLVSWRSFLTAAGAGLRASWTNFASFVGPGLLYAPLWSKHRDFIPFFVGVAVP